MPEKINRENIGQAFQELTKFHRNFMSSHIADEAREPLYKEYQGVQQFALPSPGTKNSTSTFEAIVHRRSTRDFTKEVLKPHHLSKILWSSQGITAKIKGAELRSVGSAGALHPIETYLVINNVGDLPVGLYHYNIRAHALDLLIQDDFSIGMVNACMGQEFLGQAAVNFLWTGLFKRNTWRYSQRGYRYTYLECGHVVQNAIIACQAMDVASCEVGAFFDDELNLLLGLDGHEESILSILSCGMSEISNTPIISEIIPAKTKIEKLSE
ncbi:MAG: nitroreductase [Planctomycetota bacterium]|nr:MAG: nitroreductase [Planctomycetota bacterium]